MKLSESQERWHALNNLDERSLRELMTLLEIFRDDIVFVLNTQDIPSAEPVEFLKRLSAAIRGHYAWLRRDDGHLSAFSGKCSPCGTGSLAIDKKTKGHDRIDLAGRQTSVAPQPSTACHLCF